MTIRKTQIAILLGIILLGFGLRLYHLDAAAFRGDEAFSVQRWSVTPLTQSLTEIASIEPHPPIPARNSVALLQAMPSIPPAWPPLQAGPL